jgi:hypothetical protein
MKIEILATESMGVRSLCCLVTAGARKILIDPGIALGYTRYNLLPHPVQVAVDERLRDRIVMAWAEATDIVISHFHGDHMPLINANPFQLSAERVTGSNRTATIWVKSAQNSPNETHRRRALAQVLNQEFYAAANVRDGTLSFSHPVPHGASDVRGTTVIMTRIRDGVTFVHASDIQLLNAQSVEQLVAWEPDVVLASGPPLYRSKLTVDDVEQARVYALALARRVGTLILDHHLLRSLGGVAWLDDLATETSGRIVCGADFMKYPRRFLEARRAELYRQMAVPEGWHEDYAAGVVTTEHYRLMAKKQYNGI